MTFDPGTIAAATSGNAADDGSAAIAIAQPLSGSPNSRSMISVWSRLGTGSSMLTDAPLVTPARSSADLTCAEAGTLRWWIAPNVSPWTVIGRWSPPANRAPIRSSGAVTRRIGRFDSEASPVSVTLNPATPAHAPSSKRAAVPLLPQSTGSLGEVHTAPVTCHSPGPTRSTVAPSAATARPVASTSSLSSSPVIRVVPFASAPRINARCEQLLSPGMFALPDNGPPRLAVSFI